MSDQKRVTINDIVAATGFAVGTVNRALSGTGRIKKETREYILETADRLGYRVNVAAQALRRNRLTIGVILYNAVDEYIQDVYRGVCAAARELDAFNVTTDIRLLPYTTNEACRRQTIELMSTFRDQHYHGIVLCPSSPEEQLDEISKIIDEVFEDKIPVSTITTDVPNSRRLLHVSVNAHLVGKLAAELLSMFCRGQDVAILNHSTKASTNREYVEGFMEFAGRDTFRSIRIYAHYDEHDRVLRETERMIEDNPELSGIYMATASSALACAHLRDMGKTGYRIITTDLSKETPALLKEGLAFATLYQNPYLQGKTAVLKLYNYICTKQKEPNHFILPNVLFSSNVNAYLIESND